jgi:hypothetical protein
VSTSPDEFEKRKPASAKGRSLLEVFRHLLTLTKDPVAQLDLRKRIKRLEEEERQGRR